MTIMEGGSDKNAFLVCHNQVTEMLDSLAGLRAQKKFSEYIDVYTELLQKKSSFEANLTKCLRSDLQLLISSFCSSESQADCRKRFLDSRPEPKGDNDVDMKGLLCVSCNGVLLGPKTLGCGHSVCQVCGERQIIMKSCTKCHRQCVSPSELHINVLISNLANQWWPDKVEAAKIRLHGNEEFRLGHYENAMSSYTKAADLDPNDPLALSNRSLVHMKLSQFSEALQDCSKAMQLTPDCPKVHYRKASVYMKMGDHYNAALLYLAGLCHRYDKEVESEVARLIFDFLATDQSSSQGKIHGLFEDCRRSWKSQATGDEPTVMLKPPDVVNASDFECNLCFQLLWKPVTALCGHTFCTSCLERWLDHKQCCPLCNGDLASVSKKDWFAINEWLWSAIKMFLYPEYLERKKSNEKEMEEFLDCVSDQNRKIPIFVCTLAFPSVACPLHIFEPRYRLMIRRCMESGTREFGMCSPADNGNQRYNEYGVLLNITDISYFPDGRCVLKTVGKRRFKVKSRSVKDGYCVAIVDLLCDEIVPDESKELVVNLLARTYSSANDWLSQQSCVVKRRIVRYFGEFPEYSDDYTTPDGPPWLWWLSAVLPIDEKSQLTLLSTAKLETRIELIFKVLIYLKEKSKQ